MRGDLPQFFQQLDTIEFWQVQIKQQDGRRRGGDPAEGLMAVAGPFDDQTAAGQRSFSSTAAKESLSSAMRIFAAMAVNVADAAENVAPPDYVRQSGGELVGAVAAGDEIEVVDRRPEKPPPAGPRPRIGDRAGGRPAMR